MSHPQPLRLGAMTRAPALLQALRLLGLALLCTLGLAVRSAAQDMQFRSQHIFVVDHSYSMTETITGKREKMRWSFVFKKLQARLGTLPQDGSADVTILLFNQHVPGRALTREKADTWLFDASGWKAEDGMHAMGFVRKVGRPQDGEGTALWNSLGWAMRKVDAEGSKYAHSWIYLFTDGQDTNSGKQSGNPFSFEKGMAGSQPTLDAWLLLSLVLTASLRERLPGLFDFCRLVAIWCPQDGANDDRTVVFFIEPTATRSAVWDVTKKLQLDPWILTDLIQNVIHRLKRLVDDNKRLDALRNLMVEADVSSGWGAYEGHANGRNQLQADLQDALAVMGTVRERVYMVRESRSRRRSSTTRGDE